jgi:hypothetical protein
MLCLLPAGWYEVVVAYPLVMLTRNGEDRKVHASNSTRRPLGGVVVDMSRGSREDAVPFGGGRTFGM